MRSIVSFKYLYTRQIFFPHSPSVYLAPYHEKSGGKLSLYFTVPSLLDDEHVVVILLFILS